MADSESTSERGARVAVERVIGVPLVREATRGIPWVDYSASNSSHGFEVKQVTSQEFQQLGHQIGAEPYFESSVLTRYWSVLFDVPTMYDKFRPVPAFPADPDDDEVARNSQAGLILKRREVRVADWRSQFDGGPVTVPRVRGLARRLESDLAVY